MAREKGMGNLQQEKSGRWTMRVCIGGKRYCRSTRTKDKAKAERFLQRFLAPLGLGERRLPLADVWLEYVKSPNRNELSSATMKSKRLIWMHFAKWMEHNHLEVSDLAGVTSEAIAEYLACLRVDHSATTYNGRVCVLREIFHVLANKAGLEEDPWEGVRLRPDDAHSRRELTVEELGRLLEAAKKASGTRRQRRAGCPSPQLPTGGTPIGPGEQSNNQTIEQSNNSPDWHTLFLIGIYTGLRLGDCCKLDWSSVNLEQGVIQLIPSKTRRHAHGHPVTIPIHPVLRKALEEALEGTRRQRRARCPSPQCEAVPTGETPIGPVGVCPTGETPVGTARRPVNGPVLPEIAEGYRRSRWWISHEISAIFKAANIETSVKLEGRRTRTPEATFHSLRHTFVSLAANAGVPLHIVQSIVGHESTAMTRHYYHESAEALRQAVAAIPDFGEAAGAGGESARGAPETGGVATGAGEVSARGAPETGGGPVMTQGRQEELAKIYSPAFCEQA